MGRDTNHPSTSTKYKSLSAKTGLKTSNLHTKGTNFYRSPAAARLLRLRSGNSLANKPIRDRTGKVVKAAEFQSSEVTPGRIQPDRRWFGNTRTVSQNVLQEFRKAHTEKTSDPFSVVLKGNKLPMSLIKEPSTNNSSSSNILSVQPFNTTFGKQSQRKRPNVDADSFSHLAEITHVEDEEMAEPTTNGMNDDQTVDLTDHLKTLNNVATDYILSAGTSKRIWAELYKVIDSSDVILHVLDARDPVGTMCKSVENYLAEEKRTKKVIYILNKIDLVPAWSASRWVQHLSKTHPTIAFHASPNNPFGKSALIHLLRQLSHLLTATKTRKQITVGLIGYPNVGKSSLINTLKKQVVCRTAPIPGETKVWQYVTLMRKIYLLDCPGIVPPSAASDTEADKVLRGTVRVEHLSNPADYIPVLVDRVKKEYLVKTYGVSDWSNPEDFLKKLALKGGKLLKGGEPDYRTVATMILNDWIRGKIPYFVAPPANPNHTNPKEEKLPSLGELNATSAAAFGSKKTTVTDEQLEEEADEEWGGIEESNKDQLMDEGGEQEAEEGSESESEDLTWEDMFGGPKPETAELSEPKPEIESDEEKPQIKKQRMTTNKKKASNFYTSANVKNRHNRRN